MKKKLTGILFLSLIAHSAEEKSDVAGWVVQCAGDWEDRTNPEHPAKLPCKDARGNLWHPLTRESKLALAANKPKQWIDVRIARTGEKHRFDCDKLDKPGYECNPPPLQFAKFVPKEQNAGGLQAFLDSPGKAYSRVRLMLSRSETSDAARITADHAMVSQASRLTLRDLLRPTAPPGEYLLELCPFDAENGCPSAHKPLSLKWAPDSPGPWPQPVNPGLFEIVLSKVVNGTSMRTTDRGLLLVTTKQNETLVHQQVQAGEELFLNQWKDTSEGRLMFHALLVDLAARGL